MALWVSGSTGPGHGVLHMEGGPGACLVGGVLTGGGSTSRSGWLGVLSVRSSVELARREGAGGTGPGGQTWVDGHAGGGFAVSVIPEQPPRALLTSAPRIRGPGGPGPPPHAQVWGRCRAGRKLPAPGLLSSMPEFTDPSLTSSCACPLGKPPASIRRETCPLKLTVFGGWGGRQTMQTKSANAHGSGEGQPL